MENCIFCKIASGKIDSAKIYEDDDFFAFLDIKPVNPGHVLIIPKKHIDYFFEIEDNLYIKIFKTAKKLSKSLKKITQAKRIGLVVEGFGVPHAHLHLIPINNQGEINPSNAREEKNENLLKLAERIKREIN